MLNKKEEKIFVKLYERYIDKVVLPTLKTIYAFELEEDKKQVDLLVTNFKELLTNEEENEVIQKKVLKIKSILQEQIKELGKCPTTKAEIDSFLMFRFKFFEQYFNYLMNVAQDRAESDYEYTDFINLMKSLLTMQEPNENILELVFSEDGECQLYLDGEPQSEDYFIEKNAPFVGFLDSIDLALSIMVSISPKGVIVKNAKYNKRDGFLQELKDIFEARLQIEE